MLAGRMRQWRRNPKIAPIPVICVGNAVVGGSGKTPVVLSLIALLRAQGYTPHVLSRGYGGQGVTHMPRQVQATTDSAADVGDEPLLLAAHAPTWVGHDRAASARAAAEAGALVALMDDGWQSPALRKDINLLVLDGAYGVGNGFGLPAGPLRESWRAALARADAVVLYGEDRQGLLTGTALPVFRVTLQAAPEARARWNGQRVLAFAGIARPEKFFATLESLGAEIVARHTFPDHYAYDKEVFTLMAEAQAMNAVAVTTEKDWVRLTERERVEYLPVHCVWENEAALSAWLTERLARLG